MTDQAFCDKCGAARGAGAFCSTCGSAFAASAPTAQPTIQQGLAGGMLELEKMRMKLVVGRLIGIAIGLTIWWLVIGPVFADNPLIIAIGLLVALFGGMYVGSLVVMSRGR